MLNLDRAGTRHRVWLAVGALLLLLLFLFVRCGGSILCGSENQEIGKAAKLAAAGQLQGLSRSEIVARYGPPRTDGRFHSSFYYYWRPQSSCVDDEWLIFVVDDQDRVILAEVTND